MLLAHASAHIHPHFSDADSNGGHYALESSHYFRGWTQKVQSCDGGSMRETMGSRRAANILLGIQGDLQCRTAEADSAITAHRQS